MTTLKLTDERAWELVTNAGFTADDVATVARYRAQREHDRLVEAVAVAETMYNQVWGQVGLPVPDQDRWGRGEKLTRTDVDGAFRLVGAQRAEARRRAEEPWDPAGSPGDALHALARRVRDEDHEEARLIVDYAARWMTTAQQAAAPGRHDDSI